VSIEPTNLMAQLQHRAAGNPPSTLPDAAISNCFPGLEFDFRNLWRRVFAGIELYEAGGLVTRADPPHENLLGMELVRVGDVRVLFGVRGPGSAGPDTLLGSVTMEWSNALAHVLAADAGQPVTCHFAEANPVGADPPIVATADLTIRPIMALSEAGGARLAVIDEGAVAPGELTQSLCSPWQNDYLECGCYYWAASRPDYVNRAGEADGTTTGTNWLARDRTSRTWFDRNQFDYEDLFRGWQEILRFIVGGRDSE
jgi:hypothetical protein